MEALMRSTEQASADERTMRMLRLFEQALRSRADISISSTLRGIQASNYLARRARRMYESTAERDFFNKQQAFLECALTDLTRIGSNNGQDERR